MSILNNTIRNKMTTFVCFAMVYIYSTKIFTGRFVQFHLNLEFDVECHLLELNNFVGR